MAWEQDLAALARERGPALVAYAYLLTGELAAAQDLAQDALVATFSRLRGSRDDVEHLEAYVRRAILNAFLNTRRRRARWDGIATLVADDERAREPSAPESVATARVDVHAALARLTSRERACVVLRHFEDLPVREVADRLDLSEGAVKRYLFDARGCLGTLLGGDDDADVQLVEGARR